MKKKVFVDKVYLSNNIEGTDYRFVVCIDGNVYITKTRPYPISNEGIFSALTELYGTLYEFGLDCPELHSPSYARYILNRVGGAE